MTDVREPVTTSASHDAEIADRARHVFAGLSPRVACVETETPRMAATRRARAAVMATVPVMLTGALTFGVGVTPSADASASRTKPTPPKPQQAPGHLSLRAVVSGLSAALVPGALATQSHTARAVPAAYTVAAGDTVSSIAQRFGLPTAGVLALNGLSWSSSIFPGQVLRLTNAPVKATGLPAPTTVGGRYTITKGDTLSALAARFGVSTQSILDANQLTWTSIIYPGQTLIIPSRAPAATPEPAPAVGLAADIPRPLPHAAQSLEQDPALGNAADVEPSLAETVSVLPLAETPVLPVRPRPAATTPPRVSPPDAPAAPPAATAPPSVAPAPPSGGTVTPMSAEMRANAAVIVRVGRELGVPDYGIVIALATAMQESSLRNLSWGDRDSVGLFQQRPSAGWGTAADLQIPAHAAKLFYVGRPGYTRGLLGIPGWQSMPLTRAAQAVQISAFPNAYAKWETSAWAWMNELR